MTAKKNLLGQVFGRLTVVKEDESTRHGVRWACSCSCGKQVVLYAHALTTGRQVSCGCFHSEEIRRRLTTHGAARTQLYKIWASMKDRCFNEKNPQFKDYGGRGITVCPEWVESFEKFAHHMGLRTKGMTVDRIDNDGPYAPENCRWASRLEQQQNMRTNHNLTFNGKTLSIAAWAREIGVSANTLYARVITQGWPTDKALTTPLRGRQ